MPSSDPGNPQTPIVSVIIPAYNTAPFIRESLDSVFGQTLIDALRRAGEKLALSGAQRAS